MNDSELDEILDQWKVGAPADSLRENARLGFVAAQGSGTLPAVAVRRRYGLGGVIRRTMLAAALVVAGVFVFTAVQALSQTPPPGRIPYTVESEYLMYGDDGSPVVKMLTSSYTAAHGEEIVFSRSMPGHPIQTAIARALDAGLPVWQRAILPFVVSGKDMELYKKRKQAGTRQVIVVPGCADWDCVLIQHWGFARPAGGVDTTACMEGTVVGVETILGHPTTAVQTRFRPNRMTLWLAPDLGCFPLRITSETMRPDGSFYVWQTKRAVKVTMNP